MDTLYIVVPCYNEEEVLPQSAPIFLAKLKSLVEAGKIDDKSRVMFVDDGSKDATWSIIEGFIESDEHAAGVKLSRNRGHQNAVMAGLVTSAETAQLTLTIDADLQDDINAIDKMVDKYNAGAQIVCGVRDSRETDSFLKRFTARAFYSLMNICGAKIIYDHADFRLMSSKAVMDLCRFGTEDLFIRGLVTKLGYPIEKVTYDRFARMAGESKYTLKKMLALAAKGFTCGKMKMADTPQIGDLCIEKVVIR